MANLPAALIITHLENAKQGGDNMLQLNSAEKLTNEIHPFVGIHIMGELYGVSSNEINNVDFLLELISEGVGKGKANCEGTLVKKFQPTGLTILVLLEESHVSVHTYPEYGSLFFDIFTCGLTCSARSIAETLIEALRPTSKHIVENRRGQWQNADHER